MKSVFARTLLALAVTVPTVSTVSTGCSRNNIEAVNLAIEADKEKLTNLDGAISKFEQATQLDPTNHRILWKLALAYTKKEQWDKVVVTCAKAQKLAPKFANYHFQQGMALARQAAKGPTAWADAKGPLMKAIELDPNIADAHFELAEVLLHMDDEAGAIQAYGDAIRAKPDELAFYGPLADLYLRLNHPTEAEAVLREGLSFAKEGDKFLFQVHSLLGQVAEMKGDTSTAVTEYQAAKNSCGPCNEPGQPIAFFNLGSALASVKPPKTSEAMQALQSFQKMICKGAAAQRYADQCQQAQQIAMKLGTPLK